jgi:HK97 gp10 family phage protein
MEFRFDVDGGEDLARQLSALPEAVSKKAMAAALKVAAEPIRAAAAQHMKRSADAPHAADHLSVTVGRSGHSVAIGPTKDFFYWLMQEYGTVRHPAQPALRPAFDSEAQRALEILSDELWWALKRGLPPGREF